MELSQLWLLPKFGILPILAGAANKTFKYVLPHVSEALKTGEEVYSAMNASVLVSWMSWT